MRFFFSLLAGLLVYTCSAQSFDKVKMDSLLDVLAKKDKWMGSMAISQNGRLVYSKAVGYSLYDQTHKVTATARTHYRIGSISKVFTAVMIFQLIEEGKLQLTTTLSEYFPGPANADKITIANLLNHSSGLHNFTNDTTYLSLMGKKVTQADMLSIFNVPADFEPGSKHQYSNTNFVLLGYIIEKLDKKPYSGALNDRILNKIGLKETYYGGKIGMKSDEAYSYNWNGGWQPDTETDMSIPGGAGAVVSSPEDLVKFMVALFGGQLISDSSLNHMRDIKDNYGMALFAYPFNNKTAYGHNGGIDGFRSQAVYFPEDKTAVSYISNGVNTPLNDIMIGVLSIVFNRPYTIPDFNTIVPKTEELDKYLGVYASAQLPLKITITKNDATLVAQATGQAAFSLEPAANNEYRFNQAGIVLIFDPAQSQMTLKQAGKAFLFTREK